MDTEWIFRNVKEDYLIIIVLHKNMWVLIRNTQVRHFWRISTFCEEIRKIILELHCITKYSLTSLSFNSRLYRDCRYAELQTNLDMQSDLVLFWFCMHQIIPDSIAPDKNGNQINVFSFLHESKGTSLKCLGKKLQTNTHRIHYVYGFIWSYVFLMARLFSHLLQSITLPYLSKYSRHLNPLPHLC